MQILTNSLRISNIKMSEDNAHLIPEKLTSIENNIITKCNQEIQYIYQILREELIKRTAKCEQKLDQHQK